MVPSRRRAELVTAVRVQRAKRVFNGRVMGRVGGVGSSIWNSGGKDK